MAQEFKVNVEVLEEKINTLVEIQTDLAGISCSSAEKGSAQGSSMDVIKEITEFYPAIKDSMNTLLDNSIIFFKKVKSNVENTDSNNKSEVNSIGGK